MTNARLAITPGEPAGIGPDVVITALQQTPIHDAVIFADRDLMQARAEALQLPFTATVEHIPLREKVIAGTLSTQNAHYVLDTLQAATHACQHKQCTSLATGPVHKEIINQAGVTFTGHTEYLAQLTDTPKTVMFFVGPHVKAALLTTHIPLREVADLLTQTNLLETLTILHERAGMFIGHAPCIAVLGLNPHAGEGGHLGGEEITIMTPAIEQAKAQGINVVGPLPADTAFCSYKDMNIDLYLGMYHDQVLPVVKTTGFGETVNVTLGLPFIRTSVDHGTALCLAGTGQASCKGMLAALKLAIQVS